MMTVHKAKGLEFPVVILADPTCPATRDYPSRLGQTAPPGADTKQLRIVVVANTYYEGGDGR
jgi:superfamily I DNA/RNA helicase